MSTIPAQRPPARAYRASRLVRLAILLDLAQAVLIMTSAPA